MNRIHPDEMPAPDALINYSGGTVGPAMFHYAPTEEGKNVYAMIAKDHGFEISGDHMDDDHPLYQRYADGDDAALEAWEPDVPKGWQLGGKHDTEDGPYAFFLKKVG
jgi:hypothetical protein